MRNIGQTVQKKVESGYKNALFLRTLCYNETIKAHLSNYLDGVMIMSIVAGLLVCAFVYVIRASLIHQGEEDWRSY